MTGNHEISKAVFLVAKKQEKRNKLGLPFMAFSSSHWYPGEGEEVKHVEME